MIMTALDIRIPVCQAYVGVDQVRNVLETRITARLGCVDVGKMMNAPKPSFAHLVNAEVCY